MSAGVEVETRAGVTVIRLDRPEAENALTVAMLSAVADALVIGERDGRVRAFVLAGTPGCFSVGSDLRELLNFADNGRTDDGIARFFKTLATVEKPIIAAVDGLAMGLGATLLFHCDYVVASEWSAFEATSIELGLVPDAASTLLAPRLMGHLRAFEFLVLGERFDAQRAHECGLINSIVAPEMVEATAMEIATRLASRSTEAVGIARRLMRGDRREILSRIDQEAAANADRLRSPVARDTLVAYMRKAR
ncbi:enoyl-CoA hydratase/carnithine racemase [Kaistia hirudinis]|uniref:Enoyl-CoA hydratase/carnithine racemase n=1 Tax=Kaistia hirudinis TaxID=1293440 RepID=A0A840AJX2_9HYPH|nr:enoyl-CoA hydratase-related protein [Kaistia hirudinis]MBB3930540.1 enoyl-CoA hydratase/carnithine racemase [Kaistia hirudinis]MBN9017483.1 enoyl-CoA hydratase/isomerase family protein [Hyphomicrobiales bacterium]